MTAKIVIYADFEALLNKVRGSDKKNNTSYTEKYQAHIPCIFAYKVVCVDDKFSKSVVLYRGKMKPMNLLKQLLKSIIIAGEWQKSILIKIYSCLKKMQKDISQVVSAGYAINYLM